MSEHAEVVFRREEIALDRWRMVPEWIGDAFAPARIHIPDMEDFLDSQTGAKYRAGYSSEQRMKKAAAFMPWELVFCGYEWVSLDAIFTRREGFWATERFRMWRVQSWGMFRMRVIMTLHVWNLAHVPPYAVPAWCYVGKKRK